jgi:hypothetical protein
MRKSSLLDRAGEVAFRKGATVESGRRRTSQAGKREFNVLYVEIDGTNRQINLLDEEWENPVPGHK